MLGSAMGVTTACRLSETSCAHGAGVCSCIPLLQRSMPPDVYVFGGKNDASLALATAERFSPSLGEWQTLRSMHTPRYGCAAAALHGQLYVVGGHDGHNVLASAERFNPLLDLWEPLPPMPTARFRCAAAAVNGMLYVIGGRESGPSHATSA